jgi:chemotaxis protein histidine kinase CheA
MDRFSCPECGEEIAATAKFCRFCQCVISDKDRKAGKKEIFTEKTRERMALKRETNEAVGSGRTFGFWFTLLGGFFGLGWLIFIIVYVINAMLATPRTKGFLQGMIEGLRKAIVFSLVAAGVCILVVLGITRHEEGKAADERKAQERKELEQKNTETAAMNARRQKAEEDAKAEEAIAKIEREKMNVNASIERERLRKEREVAAAESARRQIIVQQQEERNEKERLENESRQAIEMEKKRIQQETARAIAERERLQVEKEQSTQELKRQLAAADLKVTNFKANMPKIRVAVGDRATLQRNREILSQNIASIQSTNANGAYNDVLAREQKKLERIDKNLAELNLPDGKAERAEAERQLSVFEKERNEIRDRLFQIAPELKSSNSALQDRIKLSDEQIGEPEQ